MIAAAIHGRYHSIIRLRPLRDGQAMYSSRLPSIWCCRARVYGTGVSCAHMPYIHNCIHTSAVLVAAAAVAGAVAAVAGAAAGAEEEAWGARVCEGFTRACEGFTEDESRSNTEARRSQVSSST